MYVAEAQVDFRLELQRHILEAIVKIHITPRSVCDLDKVSYAKFNPFWVSVTHHYFLQHFTDHALFPRLPTLKKKHFPCSSFIGFFLCVDVDVNFAVGRSRCLLGPPGGPRGWRWVRWEVIVIEI